MEKIRRYILNKQIKFKSDKIEKFELMKHEITAENEDNYKGLSGKPRFEFDQRPEKCHIAYKKL